MGALALLLIAPPQATSHKAALAVRTLLHVIAAKYYYQARMDVTGQKSLATATGSLPTRFTKRCRWLPTAELWRSLELGERNGGLGAKAMVQVLGQRPSSACGVARPLNGGLGTSMTGLG